MLQGLLPTQLLAEDLRVAVWGGRLHEGRCGFVLTVDRPDPRSERGVVRRVVLAEGSEDQVDPDFPDVVVLMTSRELDAVGNPTPVNECLYESEVTTARVATSGR